MTLTVNNITWKPAKTVSDTPGTNGGRIKLSAQITSGLKNNLFPDVTKAQRTSGLTTYRKVFLHIDSESTEALADVKVFMRSKTPGDDYIIMYDGTPTNVESAINASFSYGVGTLRSVIAQGANSMQVTPEIYVAGVFRSGQSLRIAEGSSEEFVYASSCVWTASSYWQIGFTPVIVKTGGFTTSAIVSGVTKKTSLNATIINVNTSTGSGVFLPENVDITNKGVIEGFWTLKFTTDTVYEIIDENNDVVATGDREAQTDYILNGRIVFSILSSAFEGTWAADDTVTFNTQEATFPIWLKRVVPAGAINLENNYFYLGYSAEAA